MSPNSASLAGTGFTPSGKRSPSARPLAELPQDELPPSPASQASHSPRNSPSASALRRLSSPSASGHALGRVQAAAQPAGSRAAPPPSPRLQRSPPVAPAQLVGVGAAALSPRSPSAWRRGTPAQRTPSTGKALSAREAANRPQTPSSRPHAQSERGRHSATRPREAEGARPIAASGAHFNLRLVRRGAGGRDPKDPKDPTDPSHLGSLGSGGRDPKDLRAMREALLRQQSELELLRSENGELRSAAAGERTRPSSPHSAKTVGASRSAPLESATRPSAKQLLRTTSPSQLRRPRPQTASGALDSQRGQWDVGQSDAQLQVPLDLRTVRRGQLGKGGQSGRAVWEDTPGSAQRPELGAAPIGEHSADVPLFGLNYGDTCAPSACQAPHPPQPREAGHGKASVGVWGGLAGFRVLPLELDMTVSESKQHPQSTPSSGADAFTSRPRIPLDREDTMSAPFDRVPRPTLLRRSLSSVDPPGE
mmetsp:Transcript_20105/g.47468  ORF Transcript_20105/g.47468 Transcript_20105/m.47468 type:complete len:479 (-) Transcript_20105:126-1562(-)